MVPTTTEQGRAKERLAEQFLMAQGLDPLSRNYRSRFGEIDLIMNDGPFIVFVEVRYRKGCRYGTPSETIDHNKRARIVRTAQQYLSRHCEVEPPCRFDVVSIVENSPDSQLQMDWITDAFGI